VPARLTAKRIGRLIAPYPVSREEPRRRFLERLAADDEWFTHPVLAAAIVEALDGLGLAYPKLDAARRRELAAARAALRAE
jgi:hypothetical protein